MATQLKATHSCEKRMVLAQMSNSALIEQLNSRSLRKKNKARVRLELDRRGVPYE